MLILLYLLGYPIDALPEPANNIILDFVDWPLEWFDYPFEVLFV